MVGMTYHTGSVKCCDFTKLYSEVSICIRMNTPGWQAVTVEIILK